MKPALRQAIDRQLGAPLADLSCLGRGFTQNWQARAGEERLFIKTAADTDRLAAEADGLEALAVCRCLRIPAVRAVGEADGEGFLVLEWLTLQTTGDGRQLGQALAELHRLRGDAYGWRRGNYLGATPQDNRPADDWAEFFANRRLLPQLRRAEANGFADVAIPGQRLRRRLSDLLADHAPPAALLHGDLWHGNAGRADGQPCLYDPAVHYGDPECDLAMAALFGGFEAGFFTAYSEVMPPLPGWPRRRRLYQLYHLLNHLNLFGGGYLPAVLATLEALT